MAQKQTLNKETVKENIQNLREMINVNGLDGLYITSFDEYLSEYVPMNNCQRFFITNFSGSVAEAFLPKEGRVKLYIDGRYFEQADQEVDSTMVEVVHVAGNETLNGKLLNDLFAGSYKKIGLDAKRVGLATYSKLLSKMDVHIFENDEVSMALTLPGLPKPSEVYLEKLENVGVKTNRKLANIFENDKTPYFATELDSIAWVTNARGYHLPNFSGFLAKALVTEEKVTVFIDESIGLNDNLKENASVEFVKVNNDNLKETYERIFSEQSISKVKANKKMINTKLGLILNSIIGDSSIEDSSLGLVEFHSIKYPEEMDIVRRCFAKGDRAIFNTVKWTKDQIKQGNKISEKDIYNQTTIEYKNQGATEQSFNTISGVGANGSIIHYGDPKSDLIVKPNDMILLDSGGYFDGGFATDTTRTFMASSDDVDNDYKKIYTLVLKGTLAVQNAIFPKGTLGNALDAFARQAIYGAGYNYNHGTGHGVGINVHEGGVRISPVSLLPMKKGQVVSIEPGIYIPNFGGVRIENIAHVIEHPEHKDFLTFECLVYIGYDYDLIDMSMLTDQEKLWLDEYEKECVNRETSFQNV